MSLKFKHATKDEVPAELHAFYVECGGAWVLDVDRAVEKAKLEEFRTNNVALPKQLEEHKQRFEGIDPDQVRTLAQEKQRLEEERQLKAGELDKVVENRIKGVRVDWVKQMATLNSERDALNARLTAIQIEQACWTRRPGAGCGPRPSPTSRPGRGRFSSWWRVPGSRLGADFILLRRITFSPNIA
jgi:hypothetical protein